MGGETNQCRVVVGNVKKRDHLKHVSLDATRADIKMDHKKIENSLCSG
jgi:hypothetical protein